MGIVRTAVCVLSAMIGAGFASGREVMQFFSQYGAFSWVLCVLFGAETGLLCRAVIREDGDGREKWLLAPLYLCTAAGMIAAAGDLWALTVPLYGARTLGAAGTLALCFLARKRPFAALNALGRGLIALLLLMILLCFGVPAEGTDMDTAEEKLPALLRMLGYGGLNAALCAHILREGTRDQTAKQKAVLPVVIGGGAFLLLAMENGALLRHPELKNAALPTVMLLRGLGKAGYYLSALLLYLAAGTTLISCLSGFNKMMKDQWVPVLVYALSLIGFSGIVEKFYPLLGFLFLLCLLMKKARPPGTRLMGNHASSEY